MKDKRNLLVLLILAVVCLSVFLPGWSRVFARAANGFFDVYLPLVARQSIPTPTPTPTPPPTPTPTPKPTPTLPPPEAGWLAYLNYQRALADLPPLIEEPAWSSGCWDHARYIVKNDVLLHDEDPANPWWTEAGDAAAASSNLMASYNVNATDWEAIDTFMTAPFHAVGILDPEFLRTGFGSFREAGAGFQMAAALDVLRGLGSIPPEVQFPIFWPADGMTTLLTSHVGEYPDPLTSCAGYTLPSGLPIILQLGDGSLTPNVTAHDFSQNGAPLEHCLFDETSYINPDGYWQELGRAILDARDAMVLIPRQPLIAGTSYTASITVNGQTYSWTFSVGD